MQIQAFTVNPFGVNAFVLWNDQGDAILIDSSVSNPQEREALAKCIDENRLKVLRLLNTHLHLDHVLGNAFVERTYGVKAEAHEEDNFLLDLQEEQSQMYGLPFDEPAPPLGNFLAEGDTVSIPGIELKVLHIAGHSPGGLAFYLPPSDIHVVGPSASSGTFKAPLLFPGDIMFAGSRGRADLFGGDDEALVSGIKNKLLILPKETIVLPGHGPSTTIGAERYNY